MGRCRRCGHDAWPRRGICDSCLKKWCDKRLSVFRQAESEIGPLSADTHTAIVKRVKKLEREAAESAVKETT